LNKNHNTIFTKYCKFFNQSSLLRKFGTLFQSKRLVKISKYLKENYDLSPNDVTTTSMITFVLIILPLILIFCNINLVLTLIIPTLVAFLSANKIVTYPINNYNKIHYLLLQYSDLAFQDFLLVLNTTNSIFDAIHFISAANYPILSERFRDMIYKINNHGLAPEVLVEEFINNLPTGNLKERLVSLIATKFHPNKISEQLESLAGEKKVEYTAITRNFEGKLIIIVGICLFFPIVVALFISFAGYLANTLSILMIPAFILITNNLKKRVFKTNFELFGEDSIIREANSSAENTEFMEFLHFLIYFANEMKRGYPQELALFNTIYNFGYYLGKIIAFIE